MVKLQIRRSDIVMSIYVNVCFTHVYTYRHRLHANTYCDTNTRACSHAHTHTHTNTHTSPCRERERENFANRHSSCLQYTSAPTLPCNNFVCIYICCASVFIDSTVSKEGMHKAMTVAELDSAIIYTNLFGEKKLFILGLFCRKIQKDKVVYNMCVCVCVCVCACV